MVVLECSRQLYRRRSDGAVKEVISLVDQEKIIIMTKLALYEKKYMRKDMRKVSFFVEDYIYVRNFLVRLGITLIFVFNIMIGGFKTFTHEIIFPTSWQDFIYVYIKPYFWPWLITIVSYTIISTLISGIEYRKASDRFNEYRKQMKELEKYDGHQAINEGADDEI